MPNTKIYIDQHVWHRESDIADLLRSLRQEICSSLNVTPNACQTVVIPVYGPSDQPQVNVELHILPAEDRTRELLNRLAEAVRRLLENHFGDQVTVRIATLDPQTCVALK